MMNPRRKALSRIARGALVAACIAAPLAALAQDPTRPIKVIVTSSSGSTGDTTMRILGAALEKLLGQPVVVENVPGAGGVMGTERVVRSPADGLTLALISNNHAINPHIIRNIPFDSEKDIAPISVIGSTPVVLVTNPAVPAKTTRELIDLAKARPGALNYGSAGNGTVLHLAGILFTSEAGIDVKHVPYKGLAQMMGDLVGGQIEMGFAGVATVAPQIKAGKLRAIAVSTSTRSGVLPDVPTLAESGLPNYRLEGWLALVGPAGLPRPIVDRLQKGITAALAQKDVQEALAAQGVIQTGSTPEAARQFIQGEMRKHAQLVQRSGVKFD